MRHNIDVNDESEYRGFPPPSNPPPATQHRPKKRRTPIVYAGLLFGFFPILIPLVASTFIDDALNEGTSTLGVLPWLTFFTLPVGGVIMLVGAIKPGVAKIFLLVAVAFLALSLITYPLIALIVLAFGIVIYKKT
jgi:hypothetical protein